MGRGEWRLFSMGKKRQQLNLVELHQLKWALGTLLAVLSAWTVLYLEVEATWLILAVTVVGVAVFLRPSLPARVPGLVHRLAFPVIVAALAMDLYSSREPLPALVRVELMLILYRLVSYRRRRDDLQLIVLGLFLVVIAGVLTVSLFFAVQILAFTACALGFLLLTTLVDASQSAASKAGSENEIAAIGTAGAPPVWATEVNWLRLLSRMRAASDWRVLALGAGLFAGVVVVSGVLFMAIPRFELGSSFFLDRLMTKKTRTGFSESIRFGDVTSIQQDEGVAFTVDGGDAGKLPGVPYWRMVLLDDYREGGFRMSLELKSEFARRALERRVRTTGGATLVKGEPPRWRFYYEPGVSRYLPLAGGFRELVFSRPMSFHQSSALRLLALTSEPAELLGFEVTGMETGAVFPDAAYARREASGQGATKGLPDYRHLALGTEDRAILERVVAEITRNETLDAEEFARRATDWLSRRHTYSMESSLPPGSGDPLVRWLNSDGPGHCEFFAGGFALLARAAGHPVRLVTGFKGGSWNGFSESLIVRNSMAHAWCELWNGENAWVRVDPTPGAYSVGEPGPEVAAAQARGRRVDSGWSARLDGMRVFWYRRVVNFDQDAQVELAGGAKRTVMDAVRWIRARLDAGLGRIETWVRSPWTVTQGLWGLVAAAGLALAIWAMLRFGRNGYWWLRASWSRRSEGDPIRREAGRWLRRIEAERGDGQAEWVDLRADLLHLRYGRLERRLTAPAIFARARRALRQRPRASR